MHHVVNIVIIYLRIPFAYCLVLSSARKEKELKFLRYASTLIGCSALLLFEYKPNAHVLVFMFDGLFSRSQAH